MNFYLEGEGILVDDFGSKTVLGRKIPASTPKSGDLKDEARLADLEYQIYMILYSKKGN